MDDHELAMREASKSLMRLVAFVDIASRQLDKDDDRMVYRDSFHRIQICSTLMSVLVKLDAAAASDVLLTFKSASDVPAEYLIANSLCTREERVAAVDYILGVAPIIKDMASGVTDRSGNLMEWIDVCYVSAQMGGELGDGIGF